MKLTIVGAGHIGGATALGLAAAGAAEVTVTARRAGTLARFSGTGILTSLDNPSAVRGADVVIIAVKTAQVQDVVEQIRGSLDFSRQILVSMAAQVTPEQYLAWLGPDARLAYVIPNTAVEICESMTFIADVTAGEAAAASLKALFDRVGTAVVVNREMLPAGTALASCGIAYAMKYINASAEGGKALGFDAGEAVRIVCQTVRGASALVLAHGGDPAAEVRAVATPGGLTQRGVDAMDAAGFDAAVQDGLKACL